MQPSREEGWLTPHFRLWAQQLQTPVGTLVEIGEILESPGRMARYRYLQRYALVVVTRGAGHYEDELGRERSLAAGDWILVLPDLGHCYRPNTPGGWDEVYVMFEGEIFDLWRKQGLLTSDRCTGRLAHPQSWLKEFRQKLLEESMPPLSRLCSFQHLLALALEGSAGEMSAKGSEPPWFVDACRILSQPGTGAEEAARMLSMNYETFRRKFKELAGIPPHQYHRRQLINLGALMLDSTELKSAEIARTLGFCDEAHFSRVFKKVTNRSPRDYRNRRDPH